MESLYLKGFKGQENEITKKEFPVLGNIPEWLNGNLYRMGPGKFKYGETQVNHILMGPEWYIISTLKKVKSIIRINFCELMFTKKACN